MARGAGIFRLDPVGTGEARSTYRRPVNPEAQLIDIGFRCATDFYVVEQDTAE